jgi:hypothetical protein
MECGALQSGQVGGPPTHVPLAHESCDVHTFPSLHRPEFGVCQHPVEGTQPSSVQTFASSHRVGGPAVQPPDWQVSFEVQASPSEQLDPFAFVGFGQIPVAASQTPTR